MRNFVGKTLAWTSAAFIASLAVGFDRSARADEYQDTLNWIKNSGMVSVVAKPYYVYHYAGGSTFGGKAVDLKDPGVQNDLKLLGDQYLDPAPGPSQVTNMPGFYAALNPEASRGYTGTGKDFLLDRVELPQGLKILDISAPTGLPQNVSDYLGRNQCGVQLPPFPLNGVFWVESSPRCRAMATRILKDLGIDAVMYNFSSESLVGCSQPPAAVIIIRPDHIPAANVEHFASTRRDDRSGREEQRILNRIFRQDGASGVDGIPASSGFFSGPPLLFPGVGVASDAEANAYKAQHLLGCGGLVAKQASVQTETQCRGPGSLNDQFADVTRLGSSLERIAQKSEEL
ncbi:MAG: hypothetical protein P4M08_03480 [Oligoflexia bacterium]|nr:hypothetical protein [Oligoflexia bacterium]